MNDTKKVFLIRAYVMLLVLSLAMNLNLFPIKLLSVCSVPLPLFIFLMGLSFGLIFYRDAIRFLRERKLLFFLIGLFLFSGVLSTWVSPFPVILGLKSLFQYALFFGLALQILFLLFLAGEETGIWFLKILVGFSLVLAFFSFFEVTHPSLSRFLAETFRGGDYPMISGRVRAAATLSHSNIFGCFMSLGIMILLYWKHTVGVQAKIFYPVVGILSAAMALSGSRNAAFVLLISLVLLLLNRHTAKTALGVIGIALFSLILLGHSSSRFLDIWKLVAGHEKRCVASGDAFNITTAKPLSGDRTKNTTIQRTFNTVATRPLLWGAALAMFYDFPLTGVGPGNCNRAMKDYASASLMNMEKTRIEKCYLNAHNGLLNILAEFGLLGTGVMLVLVFYLLVSFVRHFGLFPLLPVHAVVMAVFLSFVPDAFFYDLFYMVTAWALLFLFAFFGDLRRVSAGSPPSNKPAC